MQERQRHERSDADAEPADRRLSELNHPFAERRGRCPAIDHRAYVDAAVGDRCRGHRSELLPSLRQRAGIADFHDADDQRRNPKRLDGSDYGRIRRNLYDHAFAPKHERRSTNLRYRNRKLLKHSIKGVFPVLACVALVPLLTAAHARHSPTDPHYLPVRAVGNYRFVIQTPAGPAVERYFGTGTLEGSPTVVRFIINLHGLLRNADVYEKVGEKTLADAGAGPQTVLITPQFLAQVDVTGHGLPSDTLRWSVHSWLDGWPAEGPQPLTVFEVLDAIVERLADRTRFPALREIVFIGHSAGGQVVHRYAIVGNAPDAVERSGIRIRYVVANPSSYLYFNGDRPAPNGGFAPYDTSRCPNYNDWKFGFDHTPGYVNRTAAEYEQRYITRNVTYLLGKLDVDPQHPELDRTCPAEAEGPYRFARGNSYVEYLKLRHPGGTNQTRAEVSGAAHDPEQMFDSACGRAVIFNHRRTACKGNERV